jgi:hypothetical protein
MTATNSAWLAEWLTGAVRQSTGWTMAQIDDGRNQVRMDLVVPADVVSRLAEVEREAGQLRVWHNRDSDSAETGQG